MKEVVTVEIYNITADEIDKVYRSLSLCVEPAELFY
jgi:hypothetical protein